MNSNLSAFLNRSLYMLLCVYVAACAPAAPPPTQEFAAPSISSELDGFPTLVPSDVLIPFPTNYEPMQIAVVSITISDTMQLNEQTSHFVQGYASAGKRLSNGPLKLELVGADGVTFNLASQDPRAVHVYNDADSTLPHSVSLEQPDLLMNGKPIEWDLILPIDKDYYDLNIDRLNIRDELGNLIFTAGFDLDTNTIVPFPLIYPEFGDYSLRGEIPTLDDDTLLMADPISEADELMVKVEEEDPTALAVDSGTLTVSARGDLARIGFTLMDGTAVGPGVTDLAAVYDGLSYSLKLDELLASNGQTIKLGDGHEIAVTATSSELGTAVDIKSPEGILPDRFIVSGSNFVISDLAVQPGPP